MIPGRTAGEHPQLPHLVRFAGARRLETAQCLGMMNGGGFT